MSLPAQFLDDLRARVGLASVVGRRVKLTRAGREMKGCCPFHNEKTPSFYVNEDKGFYHCFGCGAHGDAIGFVMAADGLGFMEAVAALAAEAGLPMPEPERRTPQQEKRIGLGDMVTAAAEWFAAQLQTAAGAAARTYLEDRGVTLALAAQFGLGFAPDGSDALLSMLKAKFADAPPDMAVDAGLAGVRDDGSRYERFRGRLIFPIHDRRGRAVGFGGRTLGGVDVHGHAQRKAHEPKYLNSPEGPLFDKGRLLFNWHRAAPAARKAGRLLVVEGYMDVIGLARAGVGEAVAPLGTAMTPEQIELAWQLVDEPVLAFDGDGAGQRAALRAAMRALPLLKPAKSLRFLTLPAGQDPDDLVRAGGAAAIEAILPTAQSLGALLFAAEAAAGPLDTPERRAGLKSRLKLLAADIADPEIRRDYLAGWLDRADRLFRPPRPQWQPMHQARDGWRPNAALPPLLPETRSQAFQLAEHGVQLVLAALGGRPGAVQRHAEALADLPIRTPSLIVERERLLAGRSSTARLEAVSGLAGPDHDDGEFDRRIGLALASLTELHHIASEMQQPPDCSTDEGFALHYARQQQLGKARDEAKRRIVSIAIDGDGA